MLKYSLLVLILAIQGQGEECPLGKYGKNCDETCSANCAPSSTDESVYCHKLTGRCSEGCKKGWHGDQCNHQCSKNCLNNVCNVQNGACSKCKEHFSGDYCEIYKGTTPPPNLAAILTPVILILAVIAVLAAIGVIVYKRKSKKPQKHVDAEGHEGEPLNPPPEETSISATVHSAPGGLEGDSPDPPRGDPDTSAQENVETEQQEQDSLHPPQVELDTQAQKHVDAEGHEGEPLNPPPEETSISATVHSAPGGLEGDSPDPPRGDPDTSAQENVETEQQEQDSLHPPQVELDTQAQKHVDAEGHEGEPLNPPPEETSISATVHSAPGGLEGDSPDPPRGDPDTSAQENVETEQQEQDSLHPPQVELDTQVIPSLRSAEETWITRFVRDGRVDIMRRDWPDRPPEIMLVWIKQFEQDDDVTLTESFRKLLNHIVEAVLNVGDIITVKAVLLNDSVDINIRLKRGRTPLMVVARHGHKEVFDLLVSKRVDVSLVDDDGNNILHLACQGGHVDIVKSILSKDMQNINSKGQYGRTAVMEAAWRGDKDLFDVLVRGGADLSLEDDLGNTILHLACIGKNEEIVQDVISRNIVDINTRGQHGRTSVMEAAHWGMRNIDFLVSNGADLSKVDNSGNTILHVACCGGLLDMVKYVLSKKIEFINAISDGGKTPVIEAAFRGNLEMFRHLVESGGNPRVTDADGNTGLHVASKRGHLDIVKYNLSEQFVNIDDGGCGKRTPIMMAAEKGHTEVLKHLVSEGADLGLQDDGGNNILHIACMWGHLEIVKYVLSLNVIDIHVLNKRDQTAKEAAKRWGRSSVYDLF